jgi:hypothetical protein
LRAADRHLLARAEIVLIGGSAAAIAHRAVGTTDDIDSSEHPSEELEAALEQARQQTGLPIPVRKSTIADYPINFESRLVRCMPQLRHLKVFALEKHDLALSKGLRCDETDLQQLAEVQLKVGLDFETLVDRFEKEMTHVIGPPAMLRERFLTMIKELFGEMKMISAGQRLSSDPSPHGHRRKKRPS